MNPRKVLEPHHLTLILTPKRVDAQTLLMLARQDCDVRVMIGCRNLLADKLLHPKLVVVNYVVRALHDYPFATITNDSFGPVILFVHCSFMVGGYDESRTHLLPADNGLVPLFTFITVLLIPLQSKPSLAVCQEIFNGSHTENRTPFCGLRIHRPTNKRYGHFTS
jgi:hypothetical protein